MRALHKLLLHVVGRNAYATEIESYTFECGGVLVRLSRNLLGATNNLHTTIEPSGHHVASRLRIDVCVFAFLCVSRMIRFIGSRLLDLYAREVQTVEHMSDLCKL